MRWNLNSVLWATLATLAITPLPASAQCVVPNTLTNGQIADASEVMENFDAVADCADAVDDESVETTGTPASGEIAVFSGTLTVTGGDLTGDVTTSGSTVTTLANSGVTAGTYTNATVTVDAAGRVTFAEDGVAGGSGGGAWTLLAEWDGTPATDIDLTFDDSYDELMIIADNIVLSSSSVRRLYVITNGGTSVAATSGNYIRFTSTGGRLNEARMSQTESASSGRSMMTVIQGNLTSEYKRFDDNTQGVGIITVTAPIDGIRLSGNGRTINSGTFQVFGR